MFKSSQIKEIYLKDELATQALAVDFVQEVLLAVNANKAVIVFMQGELGVGKTTFVREFLRTLGYAGIVKSPTYTLVEEYLFLDKHLSIYHFDLYRLRHPQELEEIGFREYLKPNTVVLIEWPELGGNLVPIPDFRISLKTVAGGEGRDCIIEKI